MLLILKESDTVALKILFQVYLQFKLCSLLYQSAGPKLTAKTNCRYEIEWVTEYACHRDYLESKSCVLTNEQHDISIDLSPLNQFSGKLNIFLLGLWLLLASFAFPYLGTEKMSSVDIWSFVSVLMCVKTHFCSLFIQNMSHPILPKMTKMSITIT